MIEAVIFDLDGTLVQTERLNARAHERAIAELRPDPVTEAEVLDAFEEVVGLPRREVARAFVERFGLTAAAHARREEFGVGTAWQAYVQVWRRLYEGMLSDAEIVRRHQWPLAVELLRHLRGRGCRTALATMSDCTQARRVLELLELADQFDFVATLDDVQNGKPDPEIYRLVSRELGVPPGRCLAIEDSPAGVDAALAAGMEVVAAATRFTRRRLHRAAALPPDRIVDDPVRLRDAVCDLLDAAE